VTDDPIEVLYPTGARLPLVYDSPHSGSDYPADFRHAIDRMTLRRSEDAHIDELYAHVVERGAVLLHALFPRSYIDVNRAPEDVDLALVEGEWPFAAAPSVKTANGKGLIWRLIGSHGQIYGSRLPSAEIVARIERCWRPYHRTISQLLDEAHARYGVVYHVNCHSMGSRGDRNTEDGPVERPDFVIGDRDGTTCEPAFTELIVETLRGQGYHCAVNKPYKGVELVRRYSNPATGRHSVQIELKRGRYMDEKTIEKNAEYDRTAAAIRCLTDAIADYVSSRLR
jgi:N-formylglutamate deformylase